MPLHAEPQACRFGHRGWLRHAAAVVLALALVALALAGCGEPAPRFQAVNVAGSTWGRDFQLQDAQGRQRSLAHYRGQLVLLFFGFTQCPDVCPTALSRAAEVRRRLGADGQRLQVIFVTIDPERDTPSMLKDYTAAFDPSFVGLWADAQRTAAMASDFKVYYQKVPTGQSYTMDHTTISYAYDTRGRLRLAVPHAQTAEAVAADLRLLLAEADR